MADKTEDFVLVERVEPTTVTTPDQDIVVVTTPGAVVVTTERSAAVSVEVTSSIVIAAGQIGPRGPAGTGIGLESFVAGEALGGHRVVKSNALGEAVYADRGDASSQHVLGVTTGAANQGSEVSVRRLGTMEEPSWSWTPGQPVYLGANGVLTQSYVSATFVLVVGFAIAPTKLFVAPREPIFLI